MSRSTELYLDEMLRILDPTRRELAPEVGDRGYTQAEVRGVNEAARTVTALVSTPSIDRYGEIVLPSAFENSLPAFMRNPVLITNHRYSTDDGSCPVIGKWVSMSITKEGLLGTCEFMTDDALAESWFKRFVQKCIRAFSVGFIAQKSEFRTFKMPDGSTKALRVFVEVELIEVSACAIPANRESLVIGASASSRRMRGSDDDAGRDDSTRGSKLSNRQLSIIARQLGEPLRKMLREELGDLIRDVVDVTLAVQAGRQRGISDDREDILNYDETGRYIGRKIDNGDPYFAGMGDDDGDGNAGSGDDELADALREILASSDGSR